jgi:uncharacterized membrane protein
MEPDNGTKMRGRKLEFSSWMTGFLLLTVIIPAVIIILLPPDQRADGLATLASVPLVEYLAISVGIGLDLNPIVAFLLTVLPSTGICMLVIGLLTFLGEQSERAMRFQGRIQQKIEKYPKVKRYGVASSFVFVIITGIYIGSGISFLLGWPRALSLIIMAAGISFITMLIGLGTLGIVELFFV